VTAARPLTPVPDQPARRTRWTDAELMAVQFPEPRWAVPGLLCEGINMLAGAPKLGKSWMSLGIAADIANGDPALNSIEVERGPGPLLRPGRHRPPVCNGDGGRCSRPAAGPRPCSPWKPPARS
jgi:hypothetical protein